VNLLAEGGAVYLRVEKNLLFCPTPKHRSKASLVSRELRCHCVWVGQRFGGFLDQREKVFFLSTMTGGCLIPAGRVFFSSFGDFLFLPFPKKYLKIIHIIKFMKKYLKSYFKI